MTARAATTTVRRLPERTAAQKTERCGRQLRTTGRTVVCNMYS